MPSSNSSKSEIAYVLGKEACPSQAYAIGIIGITYVKKTCLKVNCFTNGVINKTMTIKITSETGRDNHQITSGMLLFVIS